MKCPHCNKEISDAKEIGMFEGFVLPNLILVSFVVMTLLAWILPWDINHGLTMEYDLVIGLVFMLIYLAYLVAYKYGKVKGKFVLVKRED